MLLLGGDQESLPGFLTGGQDKDQPAVKIAAPGSEHRFLEVRRLLFQRLHDPSKRVWLEDPDSGFGHFAVSLLLASSSSSS